MINAESDNTVDKDLSHNETKTNVSLTTFHFIKVGIYQCIFLQINQMKTDIIKLYCLNKKKRH